MDLMLRQQSFFASARPFGRLAAGVAVCVSVAAALAACSTSDDGSGPSGPELVIVTMDPPETVEQVIRRAAMPEPPPPIRVAPAMPALRQQRFEAPDDADVYEVEVMQPGTLTISTTGVDTRIRAFDRDGNDLGGVPGSLIVTVEQSLIDKGGEVFVEITPRSPQQIDPQGDTTYTMTVEHQTTATTTPG